MRTLEQSRSLAEADKRIGGNDDPVATLVRTASIEAQLSGNANAEGLKERIAWLLERIEIRAGRRAGRGMGVIATIGATAPFVGLLGTVWGIMNSFIGISNAHTTNLAVVAPGIAEALLATALGLFAAIPAVVIYNVFTRAIGGYRALLADAGVLVMRLVSRDSEHPAARAAQAAE
jgi:biopolymer transport protein ExbB